MKIFKGLENIHAVIDRHEIEWRREQGEQVEDLPEFSIEESVRRRFTKSTAEGSGKFSPERFLGDSKKKEKKENKEQEEKENIEKKENNDNVEVVEVIKQQGDAPKPHSWLYNEVLKAIKDAAGNDKKIVAVFIPVIQNGKEFEDLPVDASVTLPPVNEEDINITVENLTQNQNQFEQIADDELEPDSSKEAEQDLTPDDEEEIEEKVRPEISEPQEQEQQQQPEILPEVSHPDDFNLIPEGPEHPDPELEQALIVMEEKLDEALENEELEKSEVSADFEAEAEPENENLIEELEEAPEENISPEVSEQNYEAEPEAENMVEELEEAVEENILPVPEDLEEPEKLEEVKEVEEVIEEPGEAEVAEDAETETSILEVPAAEVLDFEEFPVITDESDSEPEELNVEDVIEEITPESHEHESEEFEEVEMSSPANENEEDKEDEEKHDVEIAPLDELDDDEVFEEPMDAINKLNEAFSEADEDNSEQDEEEIIRLD